VTFRAIFRASKALIRLGNPLKCMIPRVPDSRERCHARESLRRRARRWGRGRIRYSDRQCPTSRPRKRSAAASDVGTHSKNSRGCDFKERKDRHAETRRARRARRARRCRANCEFPARVSKLVSACRRRATILVSVPQLHSVWSVSPSSPRPPRLRVNPLAFFPTPPPARSRRASPASARAARG
jgi:hypothetical protein